MRETIAIGIFLVYAAGFFLMFCLTTQLPNTLGLALMRSALWPVSVIMRDIYPRGTPLPMDYGDDE